VSDSGIQKIEELLGKYSKLTPKDVLIKDFFITLLNEELSLSIKKETVSFSNKILFLKTNSVIKNVVFLKKEMIIKEINTKFGKNTIIDIV